MSSSYPEKPVSMLIPDFVALNSETNPSGPFYIYAKPDPSNDIVTISNFEFNRATRRAAQILRPNRRGLDGEVVALIALSDTVLYQAIVVGLINANLIPFPISPRNSPTAVIELLRKTSCHRIIATCVTLEPLLTGIKQEIAQNYPDIHLSIEEVPLLSQIYPNLGTETPDCAFEPYEYTHRPSFDDICLYLHSSGSTGLPKAIPQTHRILMQWATFAVVTEIRDQIPHPLAAMPLPPFHMSGIYGTLLQPLYGIPLAVYPPTATSPEALPIFPSPDNILEHARKTNCRAMTILPALLAAWSKSPDAIEYLKTMHMVALGGGTLPEKLGNTLVNAGVKLRALYGATEFGAISTIVPLEGDEMDWEWVRFVDQAKLRWIPQGDGTFECQILTWENHHMSVENLQDVRGYATSDLWVNHPEKKHLWKIVGRIDDVIVHISGEKTVPAPIENIVMSSPYVIGTVMFGREREQAGILIETISSLQIDVQNANKVAELRNKLWPLIEEANKIAPAFSRIFKEMILFTSANKPLPRAGKGTVMRKAAVDVYAPEIDALYNVVGEKSNADDSIKPPALWNVPNIRGWLIQLAADLTNASDILPDVDLFHQGFDSLSATFLRLRILGAIRSSKETRVQKLGGNITQNLVYSYPTIFQLSDFLDGLITSGTSGDTGVDAKELIEAMVIKHTLGLVRPIASPSNTGNPAVVLLTGSTGSLGSQILASLLSNNRVVKVYAFNRPSSSSSALAQRHSNVFKERGLDTALLGSSKLILVEGQTDQTDLGLKSDLYNEMRDSVTLIIHNAWKLDFNMSLASFEPHIRGTRHLVDFALSSPQYPRFLFTSSIAFAMSWDSAKGPCPEEILTDASVAVGATGYGQSKFVVEQILAKSGLNAACIRIGQVCGTLPTGAWATSDWLPILVKTSIILGRLPLADGLVSWIDFDTAARGIVDVGFASSNFSPVFNLVHPRPVSWNFVMTSLRDVLNRRNGSAHLQLVPFPEWYADLEYSASQKTSSRESQNLPGVKLLEFFHHLSKVSVQSKDSEFGGITFSTDKIRALSSAVKDAAVIETESIQAWVNYWSASGFL